MLFRSEMYIHDFFQNFLKTFLVCFHGAFTSSVIAPDMPPEFGGVGLVERPDDRGQALVINCYTFVGLIEPREPSIFPKLL